MSIDIDTARSFLKADGDDDALITSLMGSAQAVCEGYCNRRFYDSADEASGDFSQALDDWTTASATEAAQLAVTTDLQQRSLITNHYTEVYGRLKQRTNGVVIDSAITAAILLTLGHLYMNREDNIVSGNNAVSLPVGAQRILQPYLWIGDLVQPECGS